MTDGTRQVFHYCGWAVLLVGFASAAFIYVFAADDGEADAVREITSGRMYQHNIELMGGKFAILSEEFNQWFASLWHGRTLAYTVAVLAIACALICFWVARLISTPSSHEAGRDGEAP